MPNERCDIFCNVIDNFGDAGVCWRLAHALGACTDWQIRLFIDAPELIDRLDGTTGRVPEIMVSLAVQNRRTF